MNQYFTSGDWLVIFVYLAGIILLGVWFGKDQRNTRDYFLGSRNIPWWGIGLSIVAAETSALTIIGVPAMAYGGDMSFIQMIIGYVLARVILAIVMVPHYFKGEIYSPYQLLEQSFGPRVAGFGVVPQRQSRGYLSACLVYFRDQRALLEFIALGPTQFQIGLGDADLDLHRDC